MNTAGPQTSQEENTGRGCADVSPRSPVGAVAGPRSLDDAHTATARQAAHTPGGGWVSAASEPLGRGLPSHSF